LAGLPPFVAAAFFPRGAFLPWAATFLEAPFLSSATGLAGAALVLEVFFLESALPTAAFLSGDLETALDPRSLFRAGSGVGAMPLDIGAPWASRTFWPGFSAASLFIPFSWHKASRGIPLFLEILAKVSPLTEVYVTVVVPLPRDTSVMAVCRVGMTCRPDLELVEEAAVTDPEERPAVTLSFWPGLSWGTFLKPFICSNAFSSILFFLAMDAGVSPR